MLKKSFCTILFLLVLPLAAQAHKVNFFAYVENAEVMCEGGFPGGKACRECPIIVKDAATEQEIMRLTTNNAGMAHFPLDDTLKKATHGLKIVLSGGEGHQSEWLLEPEEYLDVAVPPVAKPVDANPVDAKPVQSSAAEAPQPTSLEAEQKAQVALNDDLAQQAATSEADLERALTQVLEAKIGPMINRALESKIGPIRRQLAKNEEAGPSFVAIFGGIGWIVGMAGIIAWFRSRQGQ